MATLADCHEQEKTVAVQLESYGKAHATDELIPVLGEAWIVIAIGINEFHERSHGQLLRGLPWQSSTNIPMVEAVVACIAALEQTYASAKAEAHGVIDFEGLACTSFDVPTAVDVEVIITCHAKNDTAVDFRASGEIHFLCVFARAVDQIVVDVTNTKVDAIEVFGHAHGGVELVVEIAIAVIARTIPQTSGDGATSERANGGKIHTSFSKVFRKVDAAENVIRGITSIDIAFDFCRSNASGESCDGCEGTNSFVVVAHIVLFV